MKIVCLKWLATAAAFLFVLGLTGCAAPVYTVDDGSPADEKLLGFVRTYAQGESELRPAIVRTAALKDPDCSTQYELPFSVATSYDLDKPQRIAWARGAKVDERLSVIAAAPGSGLEIGDKIERVDGYKRENTEKMQLRLTELRDDGDPFEVELSTGKKIKITPVEVCRGHVNIAPPATPEISDYHWLQSVHPLSMFETKLTPDEALYVALWTQGLSEEASLRMKSYHYGMKLVKFVYTTASIVSGVGAVANAAQQAATQIAAQQASKAATDAAISQASKALAQQAADAARDKILVALKESLKSQAQSMALDSMKASAMFRSSLSGISYVAGTGFYMADKWAMDRMTKLGADPLAAFTLHYKLASAGNALNSFVWDEDRLKLANEWSATAGMSRMSNNILAGDDEHAATVGEALASQGGIDVAALPPAAEPAEATAAQVTAAPVSSDPVPPLAPAAPPVVDADPTKLSLAPVAVAP